jgi:actin-like ATPase involved in cell morphogenesis/DnaJ-domain-containing protein 1
MSEYKPVVGIDLGTTFSAIAFVDENGKPVLIPNQDNKITTPSVINFSDKGTFVVGDEAVYRQIADPVNTVRFIKRRMGEPGAKLFIHGQEYTPQDISAYILKNLKRDAETYFQQQGLDVEVKDAVITVPSYFGMEQKGATKEAGIMAGLNVLSLINEPTAAALAFGINKVGKAQMVFVFDLGGETFDVTILEIKGNEINMVASDGSPELGGKNWDDSLVDHCSAVFKEKHGEDPQDDPNSFQELYERVLKAKISLSKLPKAVISISHNDKRENVEVTREAFEELSKDLLAQCKAKSLSVLKKANKNWSDIDSVLLVGGSTYMPMVRSMIEEISGKEPSTDVNPDTCVAIGAAYQAAYRNRVHPSGCKCCEDYFIKRRAEEKERSKEGGEADTSIIKSVVSDRSSAQSFEDFNKLDEFLTLVRTIDTFKNCFNVFDVFGVKDKNASLFDIQLQIDNFVSKWSGTNAPKYQIFGRHVVFAGEVFKRVLKENRPAYKDFLFENHPKIKELQIHFKAYTKDGELDEIEKQYLIEEAISLGLHDDRFLLLIDRWLLHSGVREVKSSSTASHPPQSTSEFELFLKLTCYEQLGVSETADSAAIKDAFEKAYSRYNGLGASKKGIDSAKFERVQAAYEILKDTLKRIEYNEQLRLKRNSFIEDFPYLIIEGKEAYHFQDINRHITLVERIVIKNPVSGLLQGSIRSDVPWIEPDRDKIVRRHEQDLFIKIITSKIPLNQYQAEGSVIIESNGGIRTIRFQISLKK